MDKIAFWAIFFVYLTDWILYCDKHILQKNAFDDFIKEETSKDNKGPKLKLTKESK